MAEGPFVRICDGSAEVRFQADLYGVEAVLKAAHRYSDRCHVHIERLEGSVLVRLRARQAMTNLQALAGELANEALDQTLRERIRHETEPVRRLIIAQAFSRAALIRPDLEPADSAMDPEGIGEPDAR